VLSTDVLYLYSWCGDSLWAGRSEDRIPVGGGARFSAPVQTGPEAHPASYTTGTGSFPGVKRLGRGVDHPPHLPPRLKKSRAIPLLPLWTFVDFLWWTLRYICLYLYMRVYIYIYIYIYICGVVCLRTSLFNYLELLDNVKGAETCNRLNSLRIIADFTLNKVHFIGFN